jgi:mannitol-1-phosphate 5-dehydrogenase
MDPNTGYGSIADARRAQYTPLYDTLKLTAAQATGNKLVLFGSTAGQAGIENTNMLDNFQARLVHKIWSGNMTHCMASYIGKKKGYNYYYEAEVDPYIHKCAALAKKEANFGICTQYHTTIDVIDAHGSKLERFDPSKVNTKDVDTLNRIGGDPKRKLSRTDRFVGPALLSIKYGKVPFFLARGAAMGFYFTNPDDASAIEIQNFLKENGIEKAIEKYCELDIQDKDENFLYQLILANYYEIGDYDPFDIKY